ncbi:hypothetical protein [Hymenobacter sp. YC55]|uniref:hypothetical protein n=1 Tax=Hymenobacter sp. YC55 TaxID=3034019 RepID=UPI0023F75D68|nr:hypothetical protein [Hymenobacter sp. YC55]MDF7810728.1 hypothetical protein [Hymenobacter sp. YC55]
MKNAAEVLAHLGIDENHPGPFTYQELHAVVENVLADMPQELQAKPTTCVTELNVEVNAKMFILRRDDDANAAPLRIR